MWNWYLLQSVTRIVANIFSSIMVIRDLCYRGNVLGEMQLRKEWEFNYEVFPNSINIFSSTAPSGTAHEAKKDTKSEVGVEEQAEKQSLLHSKSKKGEGKEKSIAVYTAFLHSES